METKYKTILADPPWEQQMRGKYKSRHKGATKLPYKTMSVEEIKSLPVAELAADDCHLWLWTTNQFLREGFDVMHSWGFKYLAPIHWIKPSGLGNWFVHRTQTILFGYRRKCVFPAGRYLPNIIESKEGVHSAKPEESYRYIESISAAPRLELFARQWTPLFPERMGWDTWGNEVVSKKEIEEALKQNTTEQSVKFTKEMENFAMTPPELL